MERSLLRNCSADVHVAVTFADDLLAKGSVRELMDLLETETSSLGLENGTLTECLPGQSDAKPVSDIFEFMTTTSNKDRIRWSIAKWLALPFGGKGRQFQDFGFEAVRGLCDYMEAWTPSKLENYNKGPEGFSLQIESSTNISLHRRALRLYLDPKPHFLRLLAPL